MLSGDNGILQKATDAKTNTEKATVVELAKADILGQIAENKGETISETQLKTILNKYFEEFDDELPEDLSETDITLTSKAEYGRYNVSLIDIYNGTLKIDRTDSTTYHLIATTTWGTYSGYPAALNGGTVVISLYDDVENVHSFREVNLEGNYEDMIQDNGTISFTVYHSGIGGPTLSTVTLIVNGQELSAQYYVMPPD